jgi:hypothetical protein
LYRFEIGLTRGTSAVCGAWIGVHGGIARSIRQCHGRLRYSGDVQGVRICDSSWTDPAHVLTEADQLAPRIERNAQRRAPFDADRVR